MINNSNPGSEPIQGYFVILDEDERKKIEESRKLEGGRAGVFKQKETLIDVLQSNKALKDKHMHIVEITAPTHCITNLSHEKFGIKGVHEITIKKIEPFEEALLRKQA